MESVSGALSKYPAGLPNRQLLAMIKPMLCQDAHGSLDNVPVDGWVIERKLDGWRWLIEVTASGVRSYSGRNGSERTGSTPVLEAALAFLGRGTVLDGELTADGHAGTVSTALAARGKVNLVLFDVLSVGGEDVTGYPWAVRREMLDVIGRGVENVPSVRINPAVPVTAKSHEAWLAEGCEGSVAKRIDSRYRPGYRSPDWLKVKPQATAEAKIVGFDRGKGQSNRHLVGAFQLQMIGSGALTSCSTSRVPAIEYANAKDSGWLGRTIEIKHHGIFEESGHPRHPVYSRLREDLE